MRWKKKKYIFQCIYILLQKFCITPRNIAFTCKTFAYFCEQAKRFGGMENFKSEAKFILFFAKHRLMQSSNSKCLKNVLDESKASVS